MVPALPSVVKAALHNPCLLVYRGVITEMTRKTRTCQGFSLNWSSCYCEAVIVRYPRRDLSFLCYCKIPKARLICLHCQRENQCYLNFQLERQGEKKLNKPKNLTSEEMRSHCMRPVIFVLKYPREKPVYRFSFFLFEWDI